MVRLVAILLLLAALLGGVFYTSPGVDVSAQESQELIEKRTRTSKTYSLGGDKYALDVSIGSIHYKDNQDDPAEFWKDIDPNIQPSSKAGWDWEVVKGNWHLLIKDDTSVAVGKDGNWIGFRYEGFAYLDIETKEYVILDNRRGVTPAITGNKIRWENLFYGVNLEYVYDNDRFKENLEITQTARDWLVANPPSSYGLNNQSSYLVGYIEVDWRNAYAAEDEDGAAINWGTANEFEGKSIFFRHPVKDYLVSALPLDYARHDDVEPENWVPIRKRFIKKDSKHWLLFGSKVTELNQLPAGTIIFDPTVEEQPGESGDDAFGNSTVNTDGYEADATITAGNSRAGVFWSAPNNYYYGCGIRFPVVTLPGGIASYDTANITFTAGANRADGTVNTNIQAEDGANPPIFSANEDMSSRTWTTAVVPWDNIAAWTDNSEYESPSIVSIIQELDGDYDYSGGAPMAFFWYNDGSTTGAGVPLRGAYSWDEDSAKSPKLHIEYTAGGGVVAPTVVTNAATSVEETTATLSGNITATGGENCTHRGFQWDIDTGVPYAANWTESGNFGVSQFTHGVAGLTKGELYYYRAGANNTAGWGFGAEDTFLTKPDEPNTLVATGLTQQINLTWNNGTGADNTTITAKLGSYPVNRADGTVIYDNTGTSCNHTGLGDGEQWYYRAWSWCTEGGKVQYSDIYAQAAARTSGTPIPPSVVIPGRVAPAVGIEHIAWFVPLFLFSLLAFWTGHGLFFMLAGGNSLMIGFRWFDLFATNIGLSMGLLLIAYSLVCLGFAVGCIFWRGKPVKDRG